MLLLGPYGPMSGSDPGRSAAAAAAGETTVAVLLLSRLVCGSYAAPHAAAAPSLPMHPAQTLSRVHRDKTCALHKALNVSAADLITC
jgi:hypothetical protein